MRKLARAFLFLIILISFTSCIQGIVDVSGNENLSFNFKASQDVVGKTLKVTIAKDGKPLSSQTREINSSDGVMGFTFKDLSIGDEIGIIAQIKDGDVILYADSIPWTVTDGENKVKLELKFVAAKLNITPKFTNISGFDNTSLEGCDLYVTVDGKALTPFKIGADAGAVVSTYWERIGKDSIGVDACIKSGDKILYKTGSTKQVFLHTDEYPVELEFDEFSTYVLWNNITDPNGTSTGDEVNKGMQVWNNPIDARPPYPRPFISQPVTTNVLVDFYVDNNSTVWTLEDDGTNYILNRYSLIPPCKKLNAEPYGTAKKSEVKMNCITVDIRDGYDTVIFVGAKNLTNTAKEVYYWNLGDNNSANKKNGKGKITGSIGTDITALSYDDSYGYLYIATIDSDDPSVCYAKKFTDVMNGISTGASCMNTIGRDAFYTALGSLVSKYKITDWYIDDSTGDIYMLVCDTEAGRSRGALLYYDGSSLTAKITIKPSLTDYVTYDASKTGESETMLVGPRKILSVDSEKIIFVDEGVVMDGASKRNMDRIVTYNIANGTFTYNETSVAFDGHIDSGGNYVSGF